MRNTVKLLHGEITEISRKTYELFQEKGKRDVCKIEEAV